MHLIAQFNTVLRQRTPARENLAGDGNGFSRAFEYHYCTTSGNPKRERGTANEEIPKTSLAYAHFAWIDSLSESNLCVALALPVSEHLRTPSTGKASATH
jgi:hypothetical protein